MVSPNDVSTLHQARVVLAAHGFADDARSIGKDAGIQPFKKRA